MYRISIIRHLSNTAKPTVSSAKNIAPKKESGSTAKNASSQKIEFQYISLATPVPQKTPVGPGATKTGDYKNVEYFCYGPSSFYDLEVEMKDHRLKQPSAGNDH